MTDLPFRWSTLAVSAVFVTVLSTVPASSKDGPKTYDGASVPIGNGTAHTAVRTDGDGKLASIGIVFTPEALEGLPSAGHGAHSNFAYLLPMPKSGPRTVVDHVVINWEPAGHLPVKVYDVPHFDFHFYMVSEADHEGVNFPDASASGDPGQQPPAELMPAGYMLPPGTAVPRMGVHAIDTAAPEFKGQPFTATFIYGYFNKQLTFIEPMVSMAFLRSKPAFSAPVIRPASYGRDGTFPSAYGVTYVPARNVYEVTLSEFK